MDLGDRGIHHLPDITAQLHQHAGTVFADQDSQPSRFVGTNVDKDVFLGGELVYYSENSGWGTPQMGVEVRVVVDVLQQGGLSSLCSAGCKTWSHPSLTALKSSPWTFTKNASTLSFWRNSF